MKLGEIIKGMYVKECQPGVDFDKLINTLCFDSRKAEPGSLFFCLPGTKVDGHYFAEKAVASGAVAVVCTRPVDGLDCCIIVPDTQEALSFAAAVYYHYPAKSMKLIGVTGTNGKTTTTTVLKTILEANGKKCGLLGTYEIHIGNERLPAAYTTPEPVALHELFYKMKKADCEYVVMEVSSHSLAQKRVAGLFFEAALFTNLTRDHLDLHGSMEAYAAEKAKLFSMCKSCMINIDDSYGEYMLSKASCDNKYTFSAKSKGDFTAEDVALNDHGCSFTYMHNNEKVSVKAPLPGEFSVYNALGAAALASLLGLSDEQIEKGFEAVRGVPGRMQLLKTETPFSVIVDYAHTPDGLEKVLMAINSYKRGRLITVFGCGGNRDRTKRPIMGKIASKLSDFVVVTSDNPRNEKPSDIILEILPGVLEGGGKFKAIENRRDAIEYALNCAEAGDVVLLAGKGHETYQILANNTVIEFNEPKIVAEILEAHKLG